MEKPKNRNEYKKYLAEAFANVLEDKGLAWKKEWHGYGNRTPLNGITGARYKGCNAFSLALVSMTRGYKDPRWVTMVQIIDKNNTYHRNEKWHLKKGSKASYVEYWYPYDTEKNRALTWPEYNQELNSGRDPEDFLLRTRYTPVFNAEEVEGIGVFKLPENNDVTAEEIIDKLSVNMEVPIINDGGDRSYYSPKEDRIHLPEAKYFDSSYAYNATALHELAHATGAATRLNRDISGIFGSESYAFEELIAEMTSAFMASSCTCFDISDDNKHLDNHKAYISSWVRAIKDKPDVLLKAIKEAEGATSYMELKAGLINEADYKNINESVLFVSENNISKADEKKNDKKDRISVSKMITDLKKTREEARGADIAPEMAISSIKYN